MNTLITGATGNIGGRVVDLLIMRGERPGVFIRDAQKARARFGDRVDIFVGDLADAGSLAAALPGIDSLVLINSDHGLEIRDQAAAKVARGQGVKRLIKLSSMDAEQQVGTGAWHALGEDAIRASGIACTFVRPSGFMSNALFWARSIKGEGVVRSCTGAGKIAFVHPDDIAEVIATVLREPEFDGQTLPLTGPAALSYGEMTAAIGAAISRPLTYEPITEEQARAQQVAWNATPAMVEARLSIFRGIREGRLAAISPEVERVLGRTPLDFDQWVNENTASFR